MNPEDNEFVESLNCWEDNYDVITENIQKLSGLLSLQIQLLQNVQEEKEHQRNVRHMTLEEQSISRMLNSFEQRFNVELSKLAESNNKLDTLLYNIDVLLIGQQVLVTRVAQIEEKLAKKEVNINSPISLKQTPINAASKEYIDRLVEKISRRHPPQTMSDKEFNDGQPKVLVEGEVFIKRFNDMMGRGKRRKAEPRKIAKEALTPDGKQFWVFKKKEDKFVKVGTAEIVGEPPIVRITFLTDYKKEYIENPSSYEYGFWTMTDYGGSSYLGYQKNLLEEYQFKQNFTEIEGSHAVTGYLTEEGRAVYYDQYL